MAEMKGGTSVTGRKTRPGKIRKPEIQSAIEILTYGSYFCFRLETEHANKGLTRQEMLG